MVSVHDSTTMITRNGVPVVKARHLAYRGKGVWIKGVGNAIPFCELR